MHSLEKEVHLPVKRLISAQVSKQKQNRDSGTSAADPPVWPKPTVS
jgi:hypothetical protein